MGLFSDASHNVKLNQAQRNCDANGLYKGTHSENCERCRHVIRGESVTGLACSGRTMSGGGYMVVLANYACEHFDR